MNYLFHGNHSTAILTHLIILVIPWQANMLCFLMMSIDNWQCTSSCRVLTNISCRQLSSIWIGKISRRSVFRLLVSQLPMVDRLLNYHSLSDAGQNSAKMWFFQIFSIRHSIYLPFHMPVQGAKGRRTMKISTQIHI